MLIVTLNDLVQLGILVCAILSVVLNAKTNKRNKRK